MIDAVVVDALLLAAEWAIDDRDAALALRGMRLYVPRRRLPEPEPDEFYHEDLVGLAARDPAGQPLGRVLAVHDFGAGDLLEIETAAGDRLMVPFTRAAMPEVDLAQGFVTVVPAETVA